MKQSLPSRAVWSCSVAVLLAGAATAHAQVFVVDAGTSTLYQAQGGSLQMYGPSYNASIGAGVTGSRFVGGASFEKQMRNVYYMAGSQIRQVNLPTDLFDADHQLYAIGGSVRTRAWGTNLYVLGGATSTNFGGPFFQGMRAQVPMAMLLVDRHLGRQVTVASQVVVSSGTTAIGSLVWKPDPRFTLALAGGEGSNRPYGAASIDTTHQTWDLKAAYIYAADRFRRVGESSYFTPEPIRENVLLTIRPTRTFSLTAGRQNSLVPQGGGAPPVRSVVEQVGASLQWETVRLSASVFQSKYAGRTDESLALSASKQVTQRLHLGGSYLASQSRQSTPQGMMLQGPRSAVVLANAEETLSPRWTVTGVANLSQGQGTYGMGGSFLSNLATVSLDYQTYYVPTRAAGPFEQAVILNVQLNLPGGLGLHGGSFVGPDGSLLYTAEGRGIFTHGIAAAAPTMRAWPTGHMLLHGCVVDTAGKPVIGAALMINQTPVFTDSRGCFALRERHPRAHPLQVMVDEFLDGGHYRVVSAPAIIRSAVNDQEPESLIVVALLPRPEHPV